MSWQIDNGEIFGVPARPSWAVFDIVCKHSKIVVGWCSAEHTPFYQPDHTQTPLTLPLLCTCKLTHYIGDVYFHVAS